MSSGAQIVSYIAPEAVPGVKDASPVWDTLRLTGNSLSPTVGTEQSAETRPERMSSGSIITSLNYDGELAYEFSALTFDKLLPAALYSTDWAPDQSVTSAGISADAADNSLNDTSGLDIFTAGETILITGFLAAGNNGLATVESAAASKIVVSGITLAAEVAGASVTLSNGDLIAVGDTRSTFSVVRGYKDIDVWTEFLGCHVGSMNLDIPEEGKVTGSFSLMGLGYSDAATNPTTGDTVNAAAGTIPMGSATSIGDIKLNGQSLAGDACISALSISIDNTMQVQRCLGKAGPGALIATTASITGSVTLAWSAASFDLWKKMLTREAVSLRFPLNDGKSAYVFEIAQAELDGDLPDGGNGDIVQVQLNYTAKITPMTIRRILSA